MQDQAIHVMLGAIVMACVVAALFFLRFWRKTRDRLFALFAAAFALLAVNWIALAFTGRDEPFRVALYGVRLIAFVVILLAIVDKNRGRAVPRP